MHRISRQHRVANQLYAQYTSTFGGPPARRMAALETEVAAYVEAHAADRDADGRALVVRNGKGRTRCAPSAIWMRRVGAVGRGWRRRSIGSTRRAVPLLKGAQPFLERSLQHH
jgi:hypothetical protein